MNNFVELNDMELENTDGGIASVVVFIAGIAAGYVIDGGVQHFTGKSCADWVDTALDYIF